ncbi:Sgm1p [Sugiyamaella lignohabitans]|uniref:Sgm1p n=1 Tax=Sugiyamaella lignohabitans TaxID=796027 RepID=A0A167DGR6_9ASCO|nr:Sgm1p [Sugiyamaella lignohabitans]ANB12901.1 Sgm1p [Sugiyamaella lignohabitans]
MSAAQTASESSAESRAEESQVADNTVLDANGNAQDSTSTPVEDGENSDKLTTAESEIADELRAKQPEKKEAESAVVDKTVDSHATDAPVENAGSEVVTTTEPAETSAPSTRIQASVSNGSESIASKSKPESVNVNINSAGTSNTSNGARTVPAGATAGGSSGAAGSGSTWNYLRRAVANVESTLDKVLQESTEVGVRTSTPPSNSSAKLSMQERLAMAVGRSGSASTSPVASSTTSARPSIERSSTDRPRKSLESAASSAEVPTVANSNVVVDNASNNESTPSLKTLQPRTTEVVPPSFEFCIQISKQLLDLVEKLSEQDATGASVSEVPVTEGSDGTEVGAVNSASGQPKASLTAIKESISQLASDLDKQSTELQKFNEFQQQKYEVVESKLTYLAKQEADRAKKEKSSSSGIAKTLAEKEEYIALILEEAQMLSKQELKHMNTIKKLRAKDRDFDKTLDTVNKRAEKAERELADTKAKLKKSQETERRQSDNIRAYSKMDSELASLRRDKESATAKISQLEKTIEQLTIENDANASRAKEEALNSANAKLEKLQAELDETTDHLNHQLDRRNGEIEALKVQVQREIENANRRESTLKDEIKSLEARVEHYRALSEDASTDSSKDVIHTNLLRQIEVLQSQHSVANESWHEIEASLLGKISSLEKEREELQNQEKYLIKKLKTVNDSLKRQTEETEDTREKVVDLEESLSKTLKQLEQAVAEKNEVSQSRLDYEKSIAIEKASLQEEINQLKQKLETVNEELAVATEEAANASRPFIEPLGSPTIPGYAGANEKKRSVSNSIDMFLAGGSQTNALSLSSPSPYSPSPDSQMRRTSSSARMFGPGGGSNISRSESIVAANSSGLDLASLDEMDDDFFDDSATQDGGPGAITGGGVDNNSMYTTSGGGGGGGVSLQLVGKMNMTIRRLESDLANSRQDLAKMSKAKDDAYQEVIRLMKENEELNTLRTTTISLQNQVQALEAREQTTLEMLGEKSELVQELRADVDDLKTMYRQQIEELVDQLHKK